MSTYYDCCPYCLSRDIDIVDDIVADSDQCHCNNCGEYFWKSEIIGLTDNDCPSCGCYDTVYYKNKNPHHYCNFCGWRW